MYKSWTLQPWKESDSSFVPDADFWGVGRFWTPDVYYYRGRYYMLLIFLSDEVAKSAGLLVPDYPQRSFVPHINVSITPVSASGDVLGPWVQFEESQNDLPNMGRYSVWPYCLQYDWNYN